MEKKPKTFVYILFTLTFQILIGCSEDIENNSSENYDAIIIINDGNLLSTPSIEVPSEGMILILNYNSQPAHIRRQSGNDQFDGNSFDNNGQFEALVPSNGSTTMTLPVIEEGEIAYFYCDIFRDAMTPANGEIRIIASE